MDLDPALPLSALGGGNNQQVAGPDVDLLLAHAQQFDRPGPQAGIV